MRKVIGSFLILAAVLFNRPGLSATLTVTSTADSGPGSLRQALATAAAGDTIDFSVTGTITLTSGELVIDKTLSVTGPGASLLSVERSTAAGTPDFRIFNVQSGIPGIVVLSGMTMSHGRAALGGGLHNDSHLIVSGCAIVGNMASERGGGFDNSGSGTLTLSNCVISGNSASSAGGSVAGGAYGGGINNSGTLTSINCVVSTNTASVLADNDAFGGGVFNDGSLYMTSSVVNANLATGVTNANASGGGIFNFGGQLEVSQSTIAFNAATGGRGSTGGTGQGGGLFSFSGTTFLVRGTVSGNSAIGGSGVVGGPAQGGGIGIDRGGDLTVENSTVSGDAADGGSGSGGTGTAQGGGIWIGSSGTLSVDHSTITSNAVSGLAGGLPGLGGGLFNSHEVLTIRNTILAGNTSFDLFNASTNFQSDGFNLFGSTNTPIAAGPSDRFELTGAELNLGPLQDNGGPTFTHALLCGSPAIDAGDNTNAPATDQRGPGFPRIVNRIIDIGAYEKEADTNNPSIACSINKTNECGAGSLSFDTPTASDECGTVTIIVLSTVTNFGCGNTFVATRTWVAIDNSGNTNGCSQTIAVIDTTAPAITQCPADGTVSCASDIPPPDDAGVVAADNCSGPVTVTHSGDTITPGSCPGKYTVTRIYTASDPCSNSASCTQTITVSDTNAPVITQCPADATVSCASQIPPPNDAGVVASDNCGGPVTVTHGPDTTTPGSCPGKYSVTRIYTASDSCSNSASCTQTITVNDTNAPVITQCPADVTVSCASQIPPPNDAGVVASDNCGGPVAVTHGPDTTTPGSCPGRYTVSRVYTASDSCSNSVSCTQTITVNDTNGPVITQCPADVTVSCASQIPPPNDAGVVASDDCGVPVTVTHGPDTTTPGSCPGRYTVSRVYTASDSCSNSASCTQTITVNDTNAPVITQCPADVTVSCASQIPPPNDAGVVASDNCGGPVTVTHGPDKTTPGSCPGRYTVSRVYTASDSCSNSVSCTQTITVNDTNGPVITQCPADVTVSCASQIPPPNDAGVVASDDCGVPVTVTHGPDTTTPGSCPGRYTVSRVYTASDSCSNSVSCTQTITVNDTNAPVITQCPADATVSCASQIPPPNDAGVVASDDCGGPVTVTHGPDKTTPGSCPGKYTVTRTYTASDSCSNSANCTQTITVNDTNPPVITQCPADVTVSCASQIPPPNDAGLAASDDCGGPLTVTHGPDTTTPGSCPGKYTVSRVYTASDSCSNSVSCTQTITVNDTNPPAITQCPADVTVSCASQIPPPNDAGVVASDDCGGPVTVTHGPDTTTPGSCPGKYAVTRTYTASDSCSNSASCTQTITVNDTNAPVITQCPADVTVSCASQIPPPNDAGVVASDDCGGPVTVTHGPDTITPGSCPGKYTVTRVYTASDSCSNSASCTQVITVNDTNAPVITQCPANVTVSCASQIPPPDDAGVVANDNCGGPVTVIHGPDTITPGSCLGKYTVSRPYTASDSCSNSASCTQTITVNDTNPPVITQCPADVTVSCASQIPPPNDAGVVASDDCGGPVTVTHGPDTITPGSCPGRYTVSRVYTASDSCSNSASCTQTITVNDTNAPVITQCPADVTVSCASQVSPADDSGVVASDDCGGPVTVTHGPDTITPGSCPGKYTVSRTYTASDSCSNSVSCTQTITVNDTNAPVITQCPANVTVSCASQIPPPDDAGVVASDNCGGAVTVTHGPDTITPGSCPGRYTVSRVYTASDSCSNSVSCTQTITVNDTNAPVITQCPADVTVSCASQIPPPNDAGVVASDDCGGAVTVTHGPDTITPGSCPGRYTVTRTYTASDSCSNSVSCTQTITVNDTNAPVITQCPADVTVSCASQIPPPNDAGLAASDNCGGPVTVTHGPDTITPGSCPGKYTVTRIYTASDSCSNSVSCTQTITVNDTNPPVITHCPADVTVSCASQVPPADDSGVVASDNCGGPVTVTHSPDTITPGSCPGKFTVSRTYTAADPCGNSASCTQTITINDTNPPVVMQCPANVTVSCASQIPPPNDAGVVANDNCGGPVTVTHGLDTTTPGSCPGKFTVSRTYTASDACSNSASCTQTITVNDTNAPVITQCPADVAVSCASQVPPPDDSGVTATDNCGGPVTVTHGPDTITPGSCPGKYTVRRTYTVRDACSNSNSCTQTITVNDTIPPVITCGGNKTNQCGLGNLVFDTPTATDNCGTVTISILKTETNSVGGHKVLVTRTWSATDPCGNSSTCSQTISTTDSTALTIACPNPLVLQCASPTGAVATVSVTVSDANGEALVVVWSVDGTAKQTNTVPAGKPTTTATVTFTANFVVGSHQVAASVSNVSGCQTSCSTSVTVLGAGDLYPIALSSRTIAGVPIGTVLKDIYNGAQPGNFGWLTWAGSPSEPTLVTSLTPPGDSRTYINPQNPNDHVVSIGDWVRGKPGLSNSDQVRKSLNVLETIDITVPVWDRAKGKGSGTQYHVVGFARVRLISYQLNKQNRITARFLGLVNCN